MCVTLLSGILFVMEMVSAQWIRGNADNRKKKSRCA